MWCSTLAILEGRFADAGALIERFRAVRDPNARLYVEIQRFVLACTRGRPGDVVLDPVEREKGRPAEYAYRCGYAWLLALRGREAEARAEVEWVARDDFARLGDDMNRLAALAELSQALAILHDAGPAAGVLERLAPYADRNIVNARGAAGYGSAAHHVAVLTALIGRRAEAEVRFEEALDRNAALGARPWIVRTQERYAAMLGDTARARRLAAEAAAGARELGLQPARTLRSAGSTRSP
jgi:hypothetical protein